MSEESGPTPSPEEAHEDNSTEDLFEESAGAEHNEGDTAVAESNGEAVSNGEELPAEKVRAILEVLLLVSDKPLSITKIREVLGGVSQKNIREIVAEIQRRFADNDFPFQVRELGGGYVLSSLPEYADWVKKLYAPKMKSTKLSQAALETLAVIAYKQPVTRAEIEAIRGVSVDSTLKTLLDKRLAEIIGYKDVIGKPATYGTTNEFLLHFGLNSLRDLPSIDELRRPDADS
jgi:segregation and condensation protein B